MKQNLMNNRSTRAITPFSSLRAVSMILGLFTSVSTAAVPQGSLDQGVQAEGTNNASEGKKEVSEEDKRWLITPTLSADPKLGTNLGGVIAYLKRLDAESTASMVGLSASYSDTDSISGGIGAQLFWGADKQRLMLFLGGAEINNEYDDFLGTGQKAETQDSVHAVGFRYLHQLGGSDWLAGIQGLSTNYAVGADGYIDGLLTIIGLSGFDATGLGLVLQHDTMDDQRDPTDGHLLTLHNMAYREGLGGGVVIRRRFLGFALVSRTRRLVSRPDKPTHGYSPAGKRPIHRGCAVVRFFISHFAGLHHGKLSVRGLRAPADGGAASNHAEIRGRRFWRNRMSIWHRHCRYKY